MQSDRRFQLDLAFTTIIAHLQTHRSLIPSSEIPESRKANDATGSWHELESATAVPSGPHIPEADSSLPSSHSPRATEIHIARFGFRWDLTCGYWILATRNFLTASTGLHCSE